MLLNFISFTDLSTALNINDSTSIGHFDKSFFEMLILLGTSCLHFSQ